VKRVYFLYAFSATDEPCVDPTAAPYGCPYRVYEIVARDPLRAFVGEEGCEKQQTAITLRYEVVVDMSSLAHPHQKREAETWAREQERDWMYTVEYDCHLTYGEETFVDMCLAQVTVEVDDAHLAGLDAESSAVQLLFERQLAADEHLTPTRVPYFDERMPLTLADIEACSRAYLHTKVLPPTGRLEQTALLLSCGRAVVVSDGKVYMNGKLVLDLRKLAPFVDAEPESRFDWAAQVAGEAEQERQPRPGEPRSWRQRMDAVLRENNEHWSDVQHCTVDLARFDEVFSDTAFHDAVAAGSESFFIWTVDSVHFPVLSEEGVRMENVPRHPPYARPSVCSWGRHGRYKRGKG